MAVLLFDPSFPIMTLNVIIICVSKSQGIGHYDKVWMESNVGKYMKKTRYQEWKKEMSNMRPCQ